MTQQTAYVLVVYHQPKETSFERIDARIVKQGSEGSKGSEGGGGG